MLERLVITAVAAIAPGGPSRSHDVIAAAEVAAEFPSVTVVSGGRGVADERCVTVDLAAWSAPFADTGALDQRIERADAQGAFGLRAVGGSPPGHLQLLTRYQRFLGRRNRASKGPTFDRVLARHRALHDLALPLARAGFDHALDAWQWILRLDPDAGLAAQAAALFHDVERLESQALSRFERRSSSHDPFHHAEPRRGAAIARAILAGAGVPAAALDRVAALLEAHERLVEERDPELAILHEARALSFFSQRSAAYVDCHDPDRARARIARSVSRLGPRGRSRLRSIRYRPDVRALVLLELGGGASQPVA